MMIVKPRHALARIVSCLILCGIAFVTLGKGPLARAKSSAMPLPLKVAGTEVHDSHNARVRLRGVNAACLEWTSDGEGHILQTVQTAIRDWHANIIRLPLAQDRWFGKAPEQKDEG